MITINNDYPNGLPRFCRFHKSLETISSTHKFFSNSDLTISFFGKCFLVNRTTKEYIRFEEIALRMDIIRVTATHDEDYDASISVEEKEMCNQMKDKASDCKREVKVLYAKAWFITKIFFTYYCWFPNYSGLGNNNFQDMVASFPEFKRGKIDSFKNMMAFDREARAARLAREAEALIDKKY